MNLRALLLVGVFAALSAAVAPADTPGPDPSEGLDDALSKPGVATSIMIGRALLEAGDPAAALPYYRRAWEADPTSLETGIRLSEVAVLARNSALALEVLESLSAHAPADVEVGMRLARLYFVVGEDSAAASIGTLLYEAHPRDPRVVQLRLDLQEGAQEFEAALLTAEELAGITGDSADLRVRRGDLRAGLGDAAGAEEQWELALELDPDHAEASSRLIDLLVRQGRQAELMEELQRRVDADLADPRQAAVLADLYLREGRAEEAAAVLTPLASAGELDHAGQLLLVQLLGDLGRHDEALDLLDQVEAENPGRASILRLRGEILLDRGDAAGAEQALRRVLEIEPRDNEARVTLLLVLSEQDRSNLDPRRERGGEFDELLERAGVDIDAASLRQHFLVGAMLRRQERYEEAVPFLQRAASLPGASEQVLYELAIAQQESGRRRAAAGTLEQLLRMQPDSPEYLNFYAYLLAEDGRELERARAMIDRAVEADPENGAYIDTLGWILYRQGDLEGALDQLIRAVNILGDDPVILEHLGDCLRDLGQIDEARRAYERALAAGAREDRIRKRLDALEGKNR